jgi:transposase
MTKIQILGPERRRCWSEEQKRVILAAAFAPGAVVSHVAQQADISTTLIYRWRKELRRTSPEFCEVVVSPVSAPSGSLAPAIEVALGNGTRVHIPATSSPDLVAAVLKALVRR